MPCEELESGYTRNEVIAMLQHANNLPETIQQILDSYSDYANSYTLSCSALTPLTVKQLQLLSIGITDEKKASIFLSHLLAEGETELLTLTEYSLLLFALSK